MEINSLEDAFVNLGAENLSFLQKNIPVHLSNGRILFIFLLNKDEFKIIRTKIFVLATDFSDIFEKILYDSEELEHNAHVLFSNHLYFNRLLHWKSFDQTGCSCILLIFNKS